MKKIDSKSWNRLQQIAAELEAVATKASSVVEEANVKLASIADEANALRDEAYRMIDDAYQSAESYFDERSDNWKDGDKGGSYAAWMDNLQNAVSAFEDEITMQVGDDIDDMSDMVSALRDDLTQSPEEDPEYAERYVAGDRRG